MLSIYHLFQINKFFVVDPEGPVLLITMKISVWHKTKKPDNSPRLILNSVNQSPQKQGNVSIKVIKLEAIVMTCKNNFVNECNLIVYNAHIFN